jgi:hypothetical protein
MVPIAGVTAGIVGVVAAEGECADRDAPEAILRRDCARPETVHSPCAHNLLQEYDDSEWLNSSQHRRDSIQSDRHLGR